MAFFRSYGTSVISIFDLLSNPIIQKLFFFSNFTVLFRLVTSISLTFSNAPLADLIKKGLISKELCFE